MPYANFDELISRVKRCGKKRVAVARAEDDLVLEGLKLATAENLLEPLLVGNETAIRNKLKQHGLPQDWVIHPVAGDDRRVCDTTIGLIRQGAADLLMKGHVPTGTLFKSILDRNTGLQHSGLLSHIAVVESPRYHKLFGFTDGGLNVHPDFEKKLGIVRNAVQAFRDLGYVRPKVGLLAYVETVQKDDPETEGWHKIAAMAREGAFGEAAVEGPLAFDLCVSREACRVKHVAGEVAGDVDVIVAHDITTCNAATKAMQFHGATGSGILVGAGVPVVALSRADSPRTRLCSLALGLGLLMGKAP